MKTHTIRNKASNTPIVTIAPALWVRLKKDYYPETVSLTLGWLTAEYKRLTGKTLRLTHEQELDFLAWVQADEEGLWTSRFSTLPVAAYRGVRIFETGFLKESGLALDEAFEVAQAFYETISVAHLTPKSAA